MTSDKVFKMKIHNKSREAILWGLLDNIDTLSDMIKPTTLETYRQFFDAAINQANKRHNILESDGFDLYEID